MLYQSVQQSVAAYNKRKQQQQTQQQKLVFKWKFVVIGLGIILIILIGALSQIYKQISRRQQLEYDTTFFLDLIRKSNFFDNASEMVNFLKGFNASEEIVFDRVQVVYNQNKVLPSQLISSIENRDNLLYFFEVSQVDQYMDSNQTNSTRAKFGMFLQKKFEDNDKQNKSRSIVVNENRNHKVSSVFNLEEDYGQRLNFNDQCFLYRYRPSQKNLTLVDSFQMVDNQPNMLNIEINKTRCFGNNQKQVQANLQALLSMNLDPKEKNRVQIQKFEILQLRMQNQDL